jgi:hypothetical protein
MLSLGTCCDRHESWRLFFGEDTPSPPAPGGTWVERVHIIDTEEADQLPEIFAGQAVERQIRWTTPRCKYEFALAYPQASDHIMSPSREPSEHA